MTDRKIPIVNESGYYEIRLESIGGLGANLCGKMLGELGLRYLGLNSASFSSYGSEKTGTPVKAFIRYCDDSKEIRVHAPVVHPHILAVFHEALLEKKTVLEGCTKDTKIVLNTALSSKEAAEKYDIPVSMLYCIPAQKIAMETKSRINVVMLGSVGKVMGFVQLDALQEVCKKNLGHKYPDAMPGNLEGIKRGFEEVKGLSDKESRDIKQGENMSEDMEFDEKKFSFGTEPEWGYETAPIGGVNPRFGNSVINDLTPSRQGYIPVFIKGRCINCGLCDSTCPDMVFQFQKGEYKGKEMMVNMGLDYYHCKGCLRCVNVCPTQALVKAVEADCTNKAYFMPNQDLLRAPEYYEATGPDGYITSESYLTEERIEGGEV